MMPVKMRTDERMYEQQEFVEEMVGEMIDEEES